jgi:apolipoprotein N-acyltransferase
LLWAGHAPLDLALAGPLALVPLLALAREVARARNGFGWGYLAGLVFFGPLFWFLSSIDPLAWLLLTLIESLTIGAFVAGLAAWGRRPLRPVVAVVWWVALEALRSGFPFGGFSWGGLGYTQHDGGLLLPTARTLGVLGVSAACAALAAAAEELLHRWRTAGPRALIAPVAGGLAVLALCLALTAVPVPAPTGGTVDIAAVQADDIDQTSAAGAGRSDTGRIELVAQLVLDATRPLAADPPDVTVWPENSLDGDITDERNVDLRATVDEAMELLDGRPLLANGFHRPPHHRDRSG